jgi:uncharacterized protein (DUF362 family)
MSSPPRVAVVRSDNRRGAIAQALALIADDLKGRIRPRVLIKPNLVSHKDPLPSTHADALSATLDAVLGAEACEAVVAEGASDATAGFARFGHRRECWGRPVRFFDINRDEADWVPLELTATDGSPLVARLSRTVAESPCRISLALAKTHVTAVVTLGLKNMLSALHPDDRIMMHGHRGGNGYSGWRRIVVEILKQDNLLIRTLTRVMGRLKNARGWLRGGDDPYGWLELSLKELGFLRSVEAMNRNLARLAERAGPHVSVIDGFVGMHREGPRHGTPIRLGTAIAGTDPVAVDAVAAAVMGFDPRRIGYLLYAEQAGLGTADLAEILVMGDPIAAVRRRFVPHSNYRIQRHWDRLGELAAATPHARPRGPRKAAAR